MLRNLTICLALSLSGLLSLLPLHAQAQQDTFGLGLRLTQSVSDIASPTSSTNAAIVQMDYGSAPQAEQKVLTTLSGSADPRILATTQAYGNGVYTIAEIEASAKANLVPQQDTLLTQMRAAAVAGMTIKPIRTMFNHATTEIFFDNLEIPASALIGEEGKGFRYILDGMNAERILIASECIGDGRWFVEKATAYAKDRRVFDRPIGQNQGVQFPIARSYAEVRAAKLMTLEAARLYDTGASCAEEANIAKLLASEASWRAADTCLQTHGGFGFAEDYDVERKFRETRLYQVAPISTNLILSYVAEHVLGMPRSY